MSCVVLSEPGSNTCELRVTAPLPSTVISSMTRVNVPVALLTLTGVRLSPT